MPAKQITVKSQNRPGHLARITAALAASGINISGLFASDAKGKSAVRLLVGNAGRAKAVLRKAGYKVSDEPAIVLGLADKAGTLSRVAIKLARARVNVNYAYGTTTRGKRACIVLGVSNAAAARRALR